MNKKYFLIVMVLSLFVMGGCGNGDLVGNGSDNNVDDVSVDEHESAQSCEFLLSGGIIPLEDVQSFVDNNYTEVTITSRSDWDLDRLPEKVSQYEEDGYVCYPMPVEFTAVQSDVYAQPEVKSVEWSCELNYEDYWYLEEGSKLPQDYECEVQSCLDESGEMGSVNFCWK